MKSISIISQKNNLKQNKIYFLIFILIVIYLLIVLHTIFEGIELKLLI